MVEVTCRDYGITNRDAGSLHVLIFKIEREFRVANEVVVELIKATV